LLLESEYSVWILLAVNTTWKWALYGYLNSSPWRSVFWEDRSYEVSQEIQIVLGNQKVRNCIHNSPLLDTIPSQLSPVYAEILELMSFQVFQLQFCVPT